MGEWAHEGEHFNLENEDALQLLGFGTAAAEAQPSQAVLSQALEQLLPVKFIKHNLFPLILIYFPIKRKHPIVPLPPPPTPLESTRKLKSLGLSVPSCPVLSCPPSSAQPASSQVSSCRSPPGPGHSIPTWGTTGASSTRGYPDRPNPPPVLRDEDQPLHP